MAGGSVGRSCGTCTECCRVLKITTPELTKEPDVMCEHCTSRGCGIYETRFPVCREFRCGWLVDGDMDEPLLRDGMRPDNSGLIVTAPGDETCPPTYLGIPIYVLHECWPDASKGYWGSRLIQMLQKRCYLIVARRGVGTARNIYGPSEEGIRDIRRYLVDKAKSGLDSQSSRT